MDQFSYYYNGTPISRSQFLLNVPSDWLSELVDGEYSYGYYRAVSRH